MLTRAQKIEIVKETKDKLSRKKMAIFVSLHGVDVKKLQEARRVLREKSSELLVVKKTLLALALKDSGVEVALDDVAGPFAVVLDFESEIDALKILARIAKETSLVIKRALFNNTILDEQALKELAALPDITTLRVRFIMLATSPLRNMTRLLSHHQRHFVRTLNEIISKKESLPTT